MTPSNQGVEIILKRMDSNPEEFQVLMEDYNGKWAWLIPHLSQRGWCLNNPSTPTPTMPPLPWLSDEEVLALYKKLMQVQGESFTHKVLQTVLQEPEQEEVDMYSNHSQAKAAAKAGGYLTPSGYLTPFPIVPPKQTSKS